MKKVLFTIILLAGWIVMWGVMFFYLGLLVFDQIISEWTDE